MWILQSVASMFRKKTKNLVSIVDCLNYRSITVHMPGIYIHRHSNYEIALFWKTQPNTGCYTSCIAWYSLDCMVHSQLWYLLECGGLLGQWKCCYKLLDSLDDLLGKDHIFKLPRIRNVIHRHQCLCESGISDDSLAFAQNFLLWTLRTECL